MNYYNKSKKFSRKFYKATGYKNPFKKGRLSTSRITRQLPKLAADINILKSMINSEKKRITVANNNLGIGQVANNNSGHFLLDITPNPTQGSGFNQKTGSSIKLHATHFDFQFSGQTNTVSGIKIRIDIIKVIGQPFSTVSDILGKFVVPNSFLSGSIYDINSNRDPDYFRNFRILKTKYVYLQPDQTTGDIVVKQCSLGLKYKNHHVRNNDNDPTLSQGQILLMIRADRGNSGGSVSTITGIPITQAATGATFAYEYTHYFYDN